MFVDQLSIKQLINQASLFTADNGTKLTEHYAPYFTDHAGLAHDRGSDDRIDWRHRLNCPESGIVIAL